VALETELHELVALAAGVGGGEIGLSLAVGGGDDFGGLVDAAFADAFVAACYVVRVDEVDGGVVPSFAVGCVGAV
jgi:hypothetical protein